MGKDWIKPSQANGQIFLFRAVRIADVSARKTQTLAIIGQGYVGLPSAMAAVDAGWTVIGVYNFEAKVSQINSSSSPVEEEIAFLFKGEAAE